MGRTKYNEEIVKIIIEEIKKTGVEKNGYELASINHDTHNRWKKKYPEYKTKVENALYTYRTTRAKEIRGKIKKSVEDYALNGVTEEWETEETITSGEYTTHKKGTKKVKRPAPWAVEKILGKDMVELDAVKKLVDADWIDIGVLKAIERLLEDLNYKVRGLLNGSINPQSIDKNED